jgi:SAM-dependent methyltransferase
MSVPTIEDFKQRQRDTWSAGDYATLSQHIADVGERLVERVKLEPRMRVLDVACGTGNAALPAARAGANVTGVDLAPALLKAAEKKATAAGLEIEWVEGDAESLPFEDESFDRVLSTFGHMFAPRHEQSADEIARVCRKGGVIGICTWTPEGTAGDLLRAAGAFMPPPPDFASPPILWGTEGHVRSMFPTASAFEFERHVNRIEWASVEAFADYFIDRFGPLVTARQRLGERFGELREHVIAIYRRRNEATDGTLRLPQEYLLSIIHL